MGKERGRRKERIVINWNRESERNRKEVHGGVISEGSSKGVYSILGMCTHSTERERERERERVIYN